MNFQMLNKSILSELTDLVNGWQHFFFNLHVLPDIKIFPVVVNIAHLYKINLLSNDIETYGCIVYFEKGVGGMPV